MTDILDPGTYLEENESVAQYVIERGAWSRSLTGADADNMHNLIRMYPTLTPDTSVGIIASGYQWDDPMLSEIVKRDANEVDNWLGRSLKATTRGLFTGVESWWQEGIPRALRTGVRMYQGEDLGTAYRRAGSSELARIAREATLGNPIQMGSGWLNRSTAATDLPGYRERVGTALEAGNTMAESFAQAELGGVEQYGTPITEDYTRVAESTLIHKTQNGVTASSPVSLGRLAAITVAMPDTPAFQAMSGFIDFNTRILLDPIEMPIRELALAARARKAVVPQKADDIVRRLEQQYLRDELDVQLVTPAKRPDGSRIKTPYGEAYRFESKPDSGVAQVYLYPEELENMRWFMDEIKSGSSSPGWGAGYREAYNQLDEISQRVHGMSYRKYLYTRYGDATVAKWDETLTHEFIHSERQNKLTRNLEPDSVTDHHGVPEKMDGRHTFVKSDDIGKEAQEYQRMLIERKRMLEGIDRKKLSPEDAKTTKAELDELKEAIASGSQFEFDATFRAGLRMLVDESVMLRIRNQALSDAGLRSSWRPWLKPKMIEDWLHTDAGQRTIKFLANNRSLAAQRKILKGGQIPGHIQRKILAATDEVDVLKELVPILGMEIDKVPRYGTYLGGQSRRLGAVMGSGMGFNANGPLSKMTFNGGLVNKLKIGMHRIGAKQTKMELNAFDVESTMDHATAWLHTVRASDNQIDEILEMILQDSMGRAPTMARSYNKMIDIYVTQAKALGLSDEAIEATLRDFGEALLDNTIYSIDAAANKIDDLDDLVVKVWNPISEQMESFASYSAVMESQTSQTRWVLPNVHQVRRATSRFHKNTSLRIQEAVFSKIDEDGAVGRIMDALYPEGLNDAWGIRMLDTTHALWRDWALLRVGWPMRVIPEEMLRQSAAGYSDFVTHPFSYIGLMFRHSMNNSAMGDDLDSLLTLQDLGSGRFRETKRKWDATRQSWTTARPGQKGYREGLSSQYLQMAGDEISSRLARDGHEATLLWLATGEGRAVARRVTTQGAGNPLQNLSTHEGIRAYLNRAEATQALYTGGSWIRRKADGVWVDMHGKPVPDWNSMTKQQLVDEINRRRQLAGTAPITARATSYTKEKWLSTIVDESGIPLLNEVDDGLQYHIIDKGNTDLHAIIGHRVDPRTPLQPPAGISDEMAESVKRLRESCNTKSLGGCVEISTKLADEFDELTYVHGSYRGGQHAWTEMPNGTIVDATADQFGLDPIAIIRPGDPNFEKYAAIGTYDQKVLDIIPEYLGGLGLRGDKLEFGSWSRNYVGEFTDYLTPEELAILDKALDQARVYTDDIMDTAVARGDVEPPFDYRADWEPQLKLTPTEQRAIGFETIYIRPRKGWGEYHTVDDLYTKLKETATSRAKEQGKLRIFDEGVQTGGKPIIFPEMKMFSRDPKARTMRTFADDLQNIYDDLGVDLPDVVRTPRNALNKSTDQYNKVVDVIFESLMAKPSAFLVRSPFFLQKYSEEMAKIYVFADDGLRAHLLKWADDEGVTGMFARHIENMANRSGFRKVPPTGKGGLNLANDLENLDRMAKSRSLQATRDLFYDLAERHNITDMTKHIFPFADAWFEVLSRWAKLLFANPEVAPRNWRRFQVGITNVRKEGYFSEDEYGRETFNWPGAGLMAPWFGGNPDDVNLQAKVGLDQLMFIDPNPRGLLIPGSHPMIQFPGRMAQPHLEKIPALRNAVNWFAFGDFQQIEQQSVGEAVMDFAPSWVKQVTALLFAEEYKKEFGDDVGMMYEMLLASQNPQYGQDTIDQANATMDQANATVTALSYLKIVDRFFSPATPSYKAQILDEAIALDDPMWLTAIALAREWTASLEFFGDNNAAREYFLSRFGIDPLDHTASTFKIADAPTTESGYNYLRQNPELYKHAPNTMMAWVHAPEDEAFYSIAWQRQKAEGQRVPITPEQRMWVINEQSGWHEWNLVKEQADRWVSEIKASTAERSQERIQQLDVVQEWKNRRNDEIYETYWAWDNQGNRNNVGRPERATPKQLWGELQQAGTPGTEAYKMGQELDPAMSEWLVEFNKMVKLMTEYSLSVHEDKAVGVDKGSDGRTWWLSSTSQDAVQLQTAFVDRMNLAAIGVPEATSIRIQYILERYVEPVFKDFDWDEELWLTPTPIPDDPVRPSWDDTIPLAPQEMAVAP